MMNVKCGIPCMYVYMYACIVPLNYNFIFTCTDIHDNTTQVTEYLLCVHMDHISHSMEYTHLVLFIMCHGCTIYTWNGHVINTCGHTCIIMVPLLYMYMFI